ncbi:MAG: flagellar FliJ family protein [Ignavibacteriaceae bacterium]|nr:flagellar FliJ family protein [Ignavibacteriaceae bacterium]
MSKFVYKFHAIQQVKEILQKKVQKEIAIIELEIEGLKNQFDIISEEALESKRSFTKKEVSVGEIKFRKNYELCLERKKAMILENIEKLNKKKEIKLSELVQKSKEQKIFDSLEEVYHDNFNKEQNRSELKFIDELATQKFIRQTK